MLTSQPGAGFSRKDLNCGEALLGIATGDFNGDSRPDGKDGLVLRSLRSGEAIRRRGRAGREMFEWLESRLLLTTWYVDGGAVGALHDGVSWGSAFVNPQAALAQAVAGDEIRVAGGTYMPTSTSDRNATFQLKSGVALLGGFGGLSAANADDRDIVLYPTVLSGEIGAIGSKADNSCHVVNGSGTDGSAILDGFTITAGYSNGSNIGSVGAGMYNSKGSPSIRNCTFFANLAPARQTTDSGAAIYNSASSPLIVNCIFGANAAGQFGGAIYNYSFSSPIIVNCLFSGNSAVYGGAIANAMSSAQIINCTFAANMAELGGDSIYNASSSPVIQNSILWDGATPIVDSASSTTVAFSDVRGGYAGMGNINADPLFVRSPWAGSDGVFGSADDDLGDLRLGTGSLAVDAGSNIAVPSGVTTDLANLPRIVHGTIDLGAFEGSVIRAHMIIYVDHDAPGANTGGSWSDAFTSLQSALLAASDGDVIRVAGGTYTPDAADRSKSFSLRSGVAIYGGFGGDDAANPDLRDLSAHPTVLSGEIGEAGRNDNSLHVVSATVLGTGTVLDGVIVLLGNATGTSSSDPAAYGGALLVSGGFAPALSDCAFNGNTALYGGGAINFFLAQSPILVNCTFAGNTSYYGGAINDFNSSPALVNCTFAANTATGGGGGSFYHASANPSFSNCILWDDGVTISEKSATASLTYSDVRNGFAGIGNISANPMFVRSPWAGPDGDFGTADDDYGDLRLRAGSPAVDIGSNLAVTAALDMAGKPRIQNSVVDLGSNEGAVVSVPRILYVDAAAQGTHAGTSWSDAFVSLESALLAAKDGDSIRMAGGTYIPTATSDRTISFVLRNGVGIYGGYTGAAGGDGDSRDISLHATILSGNIGASASASDNSYHVVSARCLDLSSRLDGVTITAGMANGDVRSTINSSSGGGMYNFAASPTIADCTITGNSAADGGGGMFNYWYSSPNITYCTFSGNSGGSGGALTNAGSSPIIDTSTFSGNGASIGGAIYNYYSAAAPIISRSTFTANSASSYGGAVVFSGTRTSINNCSFVYNSAVTAGGAIYSASAPGNFVLNCDFVSNSAPAGSAIYNFNFSTLNVVNSILWNNSANPIYSPSPASTLITYSDVQGGHAGTGNINADPQFTRNPSGADLGDLHLKPASPCIDAGNSGASGLGSITTDFFGAPRFQNVPEVIDTGAGGPAVVDMGYSELATRFVYYAGAAVSGIDPSKAPLLPGQTASFSNYTSYAGGITGIFVDLLHPHLPMAISDFTFKVGNDNSPGSWTDAPAPFWVINHDAPGGINHVEIYWLDNAIRGEWLQITVKGGAGKASGLAADDVFYFGNAPGESGNSTGDAKVNASDQLAARFAATGSALIANPFDYNRDGKVDGLDEAVACAGYTYFANELQLIAVPAGAGALLGVANPAGFITLPQPVGPVVLPPVVTTYSPPVSFVHPPIALPEIPIVIVPWKTGAGDVPTGAIPALTLPALLTALGKPGGALPISLTPPQATGFVRATLIRLDLAGNKGG